MGLDQSIDAGGIINFTPASLSNLSLWLDSTRQSFSDTGGTAPSSSPAGRVRRIDQPAPLTGSWLASSAATSCFVEDAGGQHYIYVPYGTGLAQPVGPTVNAQNCTYSIAFTMRDWRAADNSPILGTDGVSFFGCRLFSGQVLIYRQGGNWATTITMPAQTATSQPQCTVVLTVRHTAAGSDVKATINGVTTTKTEAIAIASRTVSAMNIAPSNGFSTTTQGQFILSSFAAVARAISDVERDALHAYHVARLAPTSFTLDAPLIVVDGDSIPRAFGATTALGWVARMPQALWATSPVRAVNTAISGYTLEQMAFDYATRVKPFLQAGRGKTILIVEGGTNSLAFNSDTAAQALTLYTNYCNQAASDGFLIVTQTLLPRSDAGIRADFETNRQIYNPGIRSLATSKSWPCADLETISGMGAVGDSNSATNYQADHVHPNETGHGKIALVQEAAVTLYLP